MSSPARDNVFDGPLAELRLRKPPFWLVSVLLIAVCASLLPLAIALRARVNTMEQPRIHIFQDMGNQPMYKPQAASPIFADGRADRPKIEGTVSRSAVIGDDHYNFGFTRDASGKVIFYEGFPARITVNERLLQRGKERYAIYCSSCHGMDGAGEGIVHQRSAGVEPLWVPPSNLHSDAVRQRPDGHLYNTINIGIRNMAGLGGQIPPEDRWAIVAYVRALQLSQNAPGSLLTEEQRRTAR